MLYDLWLESVTEFLLSWSRVISRPITVAQGISPYTSSCLVYLRLSCMCIHLFAVALREYWQNWKQKVLSTMLNDFLSLCVCTGPGGYCPSWSWVIGTEPRFKEFRIISLVGWDVFRWEICFPPSEVFSIKYDTFSLLFLFLAVFLMWAPVLCRLQECSHIWISRIFLALLPLMVINHLNITVFTVSRSHQIIRFITLIWKHRTVIQVTRSFAISVRSSCISPAMKMAHERQGLGEKYIRRYKSPPVPL